MSAAKLSGHLLLATPQIDDGIFFRSVILLLHHDQDGAQGVIVNLPLAAEVDAVLPGWGSVGAASRQLFHGGPVEGDSALGLAAVAEGLAPPPGVRPILAGLALVDLDGDPQELRSRVLDLRVFAGYAGWSSGQLEAEIASGSWYVVERESADPFAPGGLELWRRILARQRGPLALVASYPRDPGQN